MICALVVAAGESRRMGGTDKVLASLGGKPVLLRAVEPFQGCALIDTVVVVVAGRNLAQCRELLSAPEYSKIAAVGVGGQRRQDSVLAGLRALPGCEWVVIHDGARPLMTADIIERGLEAARETGAAIAAVPVTDTIKIAGADGIIRQTPDRAGLWAAQTPQVFRFDIIDRAYRNAGDEVTDDASLVEKIGLKVKLFMGSYRNIKITAPDDLAYAEALLRQK